jgi:putative ABC transport system permease protein
MNDPQQTPAPHAARAATWRRYLRFWGPRAEADVDDEFAFHVDMRAREYMERGMSPTDARRAATRRLGDLAGARAECIAITARRERRMTRAQLVDAFVHDVQFAWRTLRRHTGWTIVAVTTLALGIGANTAVFSVVNTLMLHPLPYPNADRIAFIYQEPTTGNSTGMRVTVTPPASLVRAWRENARSFESIEAYTSSDWALQTSDGTPASVQTASVLPSFGAFVGARPIIGREFTAADIADGGRVVLLSEPFWRSRYASDRGIIGKPIVLDNQPYTVIGVMPAVYRLPRLTDAVSNVWLPLDLRNESMGLWVMGRLRPGIRMADAARELDSVFARSSPKSGTKSGGRMDFNVKLTSPRDLVSFRQSLLLLSGAVALVLLIACGNVAHLLLAKTASRQRELAIRAALGASRLRLVRQLLTESLILAVAGCVGGIVVGWAGLHLLVAMRPDSLPELAEARIDGMTLLVTAGLATMTGLAVGVLGALQSVRLAAHDALKAGATSVSQSRRQRRVRSLLVVSEMALSTVLLVGATLLVRSIVHLQTLDPGFDPSRLYALRINLPEARYKTPAARTAFLSDVSARVRRVPGVVGATVAAGAPPSRSFFIGALQVEGEAPPPDGTTSFVDYNGVEPDYFRMMGMRLIEGSTITDTTKAASQALVNEGFAKKYWPGKSALGHRIRVVYKGQGDWRTIVGVAADALTGGLTGDATRPMLYTPAMDLFQPALIVRTVPGTDPMPAIRALVREADAALQPPDVTNIEDAMSRTVAGPRFTMVLLVAFTLLALLLAAVGLYGVMAYAVAQQTREIGIRIALGATRSAIAKSVLSRGVLMASIGALVGALGARWGSKLLEHMLYGVARTDAASFAIGVTVLIVTAVVACLVPMRRAVSVDPLVSIRAD